MAEKRYEMDMCSGPLLSKILAFTLPLILSSMLQLLFNAADVIVVGRYAGSTALAAVGSTGALINLIVNLFMGLSVGVSVTVARHYGAREYADVTTTVHTAILMSIIGGIAAGAFGFFMAKPLLALMGSPADVIDQAALYVRIYFIGMPASMFYNFGSAVLRAVGDTKRPLYYLSAAGVLNVLLNLLFVIRFSMGVAGVALATSISQYLSAALIAICLMRSESCYRLHWDELALHKDKALPIIRIGLPAGLQSSIFAISNVVIQSSINSFGSIAMAGSAAAANIEGFVYVSMNSVAQASLSFASQNIGARRYERISKISRTCLLLAALFGLVLGNGVYLLHDTFLRFYSPDPRRNRSGRLAPFRNMHHLFSLRADGYTRLHPARDGEIPVADGGNNPRRLRPSGSLDLHGISSGPHVFHAVPVLPNHLGRDGCSACCVLFFHKAHDAPARAGERAFGSKQHLASPDALLTVF